MSKIMLQLRCAAVVLYLFFKAPKKQMENVIVLLGGHRQHIVIKIEAKRKKEGGRSSIYMQ